MSDLIIPDDYYPSDNFSSAVHNDDNTDDGNLDPPPATEENYFEYIEKAYESDTYFPIPRTEQFEDRLDWIQNEREI